MTAAPRFPAPRPVTLEGRRVLLRPLDLERDVPALFAASHGDAGREAVWRYMLSGPFASAEAMRVDYASKFGAATDPIGFTAVRRDDGAAVGMSALMAIAPEHGRLEIGHVWFAKAVHGSGLNRESQYLLLKHVFETLGYRRVEWKCDSRNAASRAAALGLGFRYEGRFHQHMRVRGENRDTDWYALLDRDWPAAREALQRRIYATAD